MVRVNTLMRLFSSQRSIIINLRKFAQVSSQEGLIVTRLENKDYGISVIGLNRPNARNSFSTNLLKQLEQAINDIANESTSRVLILRSLVPGIFASGADLKERTTMTEEQVSEFVTSIRYTFNKVYELRVPVIAAIDGYALGGGLELALACDIRVATSSAKLGLVETKLAIIPGAGGTQRLPRLIGNAFAKELIFTARVFDGDEARHIGVVNHAVQQNEIGDAAYQKSLEIAREILANGPIGVRMAKQAINIGTELDLTRALKYEQSCYEQVIPTKDRMEGLLAFKEKRQPIFKGE